MSELILADEASGDEMTLNMGPQHPSTHGVIRFIIKTDGEIMREAMPDVGYLHRADRAHRREVHLRGLHALHRSRRLRLRDDRPTTRGRWQSRSWRELAVPERAEYLRVITDELNRISSHCIALGAMAMDIGAITPFTVHPARARVRQRAARELCGARLTYNYHRVGGVGWDMPAGWRDKVLRVAAITSRR